MTHFNLGRNGKVGAWEQSASAAIGWKITLARTNMTALLFSALTAEFLPLGPCSRREAS